MSRRIAIAITYASVTHLHDECGHACIRFLIKCSIYYWIFVFPNLPVWPINTAISASPYFTPSSIISSLYLQSESEKSQEIKNEVHPLKFGPVSNTRTIRIMLSYCSLCCRWFRFLLLCSAGEILSIALGIIIWSN